MSPSLDPTSPDKWQAAGSFKYPDKATRRKDAKDGTWEYRVHLKAVNHNFHPLIQNVKVWTYGNGVATDRWPGVTIEGESGKPLRVTFVNDLINKKGLPEENLKNLMAMVTRQGMEEDHMLDKSHNRVHLHGARVPWTSDGSPMNVFHPHETRGYYYPNKQAATTMWYHDHAMDVTRLNVYAGLAAMYLLRDPTEATCLPRGEFEVPMVLQDRSFTSDFKKLRYEQVIAEVKDPVTGEITIESRPEFVGDFPIVNGKIWPTMAAKPAVYRWRLVNGANARYFNIALTTSADSNTKIPFHIIGTDGGFLPKTTAEIAISELVLAPGERADLLIDLTSYAGKELILRNTYGDTEPTFAELVKILVSSTVPAFDQKKYQFGPLGTLNLPVRVDPLESTVMPTPKNSVPKFVAENIFPEFGAAIDLALTGVKPSDILAPLVLKTTGNIDFTFRRFILEEYQLLMPTLDVINSGLYKNLVIPTVLINRETGAMDKDMGMPITKAQAVKTTQNAYEVWEFVNLTIDSHPMHIHLVQFRLLSRRKLDTRDATNDVPIPTGTIQNSIGLKPKLGLLERSEATAYLSAVLPNDYEKAGWKDTMQCEPGQATRVLMRFDGFSGEYVYHCHILEHEDMGMMFDINVES